ncbi:MAG: malonic semialdehyde reductase, partial [Pseudomonadota bacterium]
LQSSEAKARLKPHLMEGNIVKTMSAPWVAIIAHDLDFPDHMERLFPHNLEAKTWFSDPTVRETTAFRNGTLQSAYFLIAARALGLDCGPMSGFNNEGVDAEFFLNDDARKSWRSNWICNLGHGDPDSVFPRSPRFDFEEACAIL